MGLLETLSNLKFDPGPGSMGLLQAGANMMDASSNQRQPIGWGNIGSSAIQGLIQGANLVYKQQAAEQELAMAREKLDMLQEDRSLSKAQREALKAINLNDPNAVNAVLHATGDISAAEKLIKAQNGGADPYFNYISTPNGINVFNNRTGELKDLKGNLITNQVSKATDDPNLQGQIAARKAQEHIGMVKTPDGREVPQRYGNSPYAEPVTYTAPTAMPRQQGALDQTININAGTAEKPIPIQISKGTVPADYLAQLKASKDPYTQSVAPMVEQAFIQRGLIASAPQAQPQSQPQAMGITPYSETLQKEDAKNKSDLNNAQAKKSQSAGEMLGMLNAGYDGKPLEEWIKQGTSSGAGALRDQAMGFFGRTTPAANAAQKLKTIHDWLASSVPRMEGPQSNFDVQRYNEMAGQIGDPWVPVDRKLAALSSLRQILQNWGKGGMQTQAQPQAQQQQGPSPDDLVKHYLGGN